MTTALSVEFRQNGLCRITHQQNGFAELRPNVAAPLVRLHKQNGRVGDAFSWKATLEQTVVLVDTAGEDAGRLLQQVAQPGVAGAGEAGERGNWLPAALVKFVIITFR